MSNKNLQTARINQNDEFYTRYEDIAAEVEHHKAAFYKARVFCNCDDPRRSQFWAYFHSNFSRLRLSALIASGIGPDGAGYYAMYTGGDDGDIESGISGSVSDGSYLSDFSKRYLAMSNIVVTNPPFSRMREYVQFLHEHRKRFLIIAPLHAMTARDIFQLVQRGEIAPGITAPSRFITQDGGERKLSNIIWLNALRDGVCQATLQLTEKYSPEKYRQFDNYAALNVDRLKEIPADYSGIIGAPITALAMLRPDEWEIVGVDESCGGGLSNSLYIGGAPDKHAYVDGKRKFTRVFIRRR